VARLTQLGVRQDSWQRIGGESPRGVKTSHPPRPPHDARRPGRADVKRSQGRPQARH
jgi:hypothetical protein